MIRRFRFPLFVPSLAFLGTALVGVWAAYDRGVAWSWFGLLALGVALTVGTPWAARRGGELVLGVIGLGCALLAAAVGAYFLLEYDWAGRGPGRFAALQQAGLWIQAHRPTVSLPEDIHRNVAGGGLAITFPLGLGGLGWAWSRRDWLSGMVSALALFLALVALVLTASRGAWIGLAAGGVTAGYLYCQGYARLRKLPPWLGTALLGGAALLLLGGFWAVSTLPGFESLLGAAPAGEAAVSRAALWRDILTLVRDYPFTGSGLGSTPMVYSTYILLIHVPYISHAHNLFLQIAVQQGLPGLAAFLWLVGLGIRALMRPQPRRILGGRFRTAAFASLVALLVHGMVDAVPYVSRLVPIVFLPIGVALAFDASHASQPGSSDAANRGHLASILWPVGVILALAASLLPGSRAAFLANLGAVYQTRAELAAYDPNRFGQLTLDEVRRTVDLSAAEADFERALTLSPGNTTARQRLGAIALSRGQYEEALAELEATWAAGSQDRVTRLLLAEAYIAAGRVDEATTLAKGLDWAVERLWYLAWSRYRRAGDYARAAATYETVARLEPGNAEAVRARDEMLRLERQ